MGINPTINPDSIRFAIFRLAMSDGTECTVHGFPADEELRRLWYAISTQAMFQGCRGMACIVARAGKRPLISDNKEPIT